MKSKDGFVQARNTQAAVDAGAQAAPGAALHSHTGLFGERCGGRLLHEIVKNDSGSDRDNGGDKA
jgi:hypothetical protein